MSLKTKGAYASGVKTVTADSSVLTEINKFTQKELTADDVYVQKFLLCHDCVDRDGEAFAKDALTGIKNTIVGKSVIRYHERRSDPVGVVYAAEIKSMTQEEFKTLTGEQLVPLNGEKINVLFAYAYFLRGVDDDVIAKLEGGTFRFVSVGFVSSDTVRKEKKELKYWEITAPCEAREMSLAYLGAQPGAAAYKTPGDDKKGEKMAYKKLSAKMGKEITEENIETELTTYIEKMESENAALKKDAEAGREYRKSVTDAFVKLRIKCFGLKEDEAKAVEKLAERFETAELVAETAVLQKMADEKFPAESTLKEDTNGKPEGKKDASDGSQYLMDDEGGK
jgi:hypothetical protein